MLLNVTVSQLLSSKNCLLIAFSRFLILERAIEPPYELHSCLYFAGSLVCLVRFLVSDLIPPRKEHVDGEVLEAAVIVIFLSFNFPREKTVPGILLSLCRRNESAASQEGHSISAYNVPRPFLFRSTLKGISFAVCYLSHQKKTVPKCRTS